jgi:hypothetical protein
MSQTSNITVIVGILVPSAVLIAVVVRVCVMRRANRAAAAGGGGYSKVQHSLDEEEIEFKRMFERQSDNIDDIFGEGSAESEVAFDTRDLDRLQMLEKYRDHLVSEAATSGEIETQPEQGAPLTTSENNEISV